MKLITVVLFLMLLLLPVHLRSQTSPPDNKVQKGNKTLVSVPVTVSDREGRYISGLKKEDFNIFEDGVKQNVAFFATEDEPLSVALLLDTSASTKDVLDKIKSAARDFIELLNPKDQCQISTFDSQVKILNPFTSDRQTLFNALNQAQTATQDGTVMFRAVEQVTRQSFAAANMPGRKVIVMLSDGKDLGSAVTKDEILGLLEESDVMIYTVFYQTGASSNKLAVAPDGTIKQEKETEKPREKKAPKKKKGYTIFIPVPGDVYTANDIKLTETASGTEAVNSLKQMSETTAGRFYQSDTPNLSEIFKKIAGELRQQYRLGYYTRDAAGGRDIVVKVERTDVVVRARGKFRAKPL